MASSEGENMATGENFSARFVLEQIKEIKQDIKEEIRELKSDVKEEIEKIDERLSGNDGVMERITALEVKMEEVVSKESTPISIAVQRKTSYKEQGTMAGIGVGAAAIVQIVLEIAKGLGK